MKFFSGIGERLRDGLKRSQEYLSTGLSSVLEPDRPIDETLWEELEELLTSANLAAALKAEGRHVMLAAADTFRAAAIEQLETWGRRIDVEVVRQAAGS